MDFDAAVAAVDGQLAVADEADELGVVDTVRRDELALGVVKLTVAVSQDDGDMVAMKDGFVDVHRGKRDAGLAGAASDLTATVADNCNHVFSLLLGGLQHLREGRI